MVVGAAEETEAVGQHLQGPLAVHQPVELDPLLENPEDQVLLLDAGVLGEVFPPGSSINSAIDIRCSSAMWVSSECLSCSSVRRYSSLPARLRRQSPRPPTAAPPVPRPPARSWTSGEKWRCGLRSRFRLGLPVRCLHVQILIFAQLLNERSQCRPEGAGSGKM